MDRADLSSNDADDLVHSLNLLLDNLEIPIELESPLDLTPTLLLLILESTLKSRLPLPEKLRNADSPHSRVEAVKIFLGVLGNDVLRMDLSTLDPRRVADGEWEETLHVAKLLILVAKQVGVLISEEIIDLDPNLSFSKVSQDDSLISDISSLQLVPEEDNMSFSSPLPPSHPLYAPSPPRTASSLWRSGPPSSRTMSINHSLDDTRSISLPESCSTPRTATPVRSTRILSLSPKPQLDFPSIATSICTCSANDDITGSTVHCHCETHAQIEASLSSIGLEDRTFRAQSQQVESKRHDLYYNGRLHLGHPDARNSVRTSSHSSAPIRTRSRLY